MEGIAPPESLMNMDIFDDGANITCLKEENLKLKEQRLCKVNIGQVKQLNPALTDFEGLTYFICYKWNSVVANIENKEKQVEGTLNHDS